MATVQTKDAAAPMERIRKKPRLSPTSSKSVAFNASTASTTTTSRPKSGLLPPSVNASRFHHAFGSSSSSRPAISGKENVATNTTSKATTASASLKHADPVKTASKDTPAKATKAATAVSTGSASAVKNRTKRRRSVAPASTTTESLASVSVLSTDKPSSFSSDTLGSIVEVESSATSTASDAGVTSALLAAKSVPLEVAFLPPLFETTSASDPDFWKSRHDFARSALSQLKALEERMALLTKLPSVA